MKKEQIPIALMGLGWVGMHRHAVAIQRSPDFRLIGVIDRNSDRANSASKTFNVPHASCTEDLGNVTWLSKAAAITISTPPHSHYQLVTGSLARGLHVLTEKPFAMHLNEGESMVRYAAENNRVLAVTHNFQFSHSATSLQKDIESGRLGRIHRIHAKQLSNPRRRLPKWHDSLPSGLFYDESPHLLYLIRRFSPGHIKLTQSTILPSQRRHQTPCLVQANYNCSSPNGPIPVTLDMHFESPLSEWYFSIIGEKAIGIVDIFRDIYIRLPNDGLHTSWTVLRTSLAATGQHWLQHFSSGIRHLCGTLDYGNNKIYQNFAHSIRNGLPVEDIGPRAALDVLRMQHDIMTKGAPKND